jgi:hypothetical protein
MGRSDSPRSMRPGFARAPRRTVVLVEPLESRQLLAAGAFQPIMAPALAVPAIIGPAQASPISPIAPPAPVANQAPSIEIVFGLISVGAGASAGHGFVETVFIFESSFSSGSIGAAGQAPNNPTTGPLAGGSAGATGSIAPLTPTVLAGSAGRNQTPVVVIVLPQPLVVNLAPSTISVTTQAILATALLEEQPLPPPVLGQGFESPVGQALESSPERGLPGHLIPARVKAEPPATDFIEPYLPVLEENAPPAEPGQPVGPPVAPAPPQDSTAVDTAEVEPLALTDPTEAPRFPTSSPRLDAETPADTPMWSLSTVVGTAAVVSGGYRLALGGSSRFNQRWIPTRRSSRMTRGRRSGVV